MHKRTIKIDCTACQGVSQSDARHCHECKGRRFIERDGIICEGVEYYDPGVGGWECYVCGGSGPL